MFKPIAAFVTGVALVACVLSASPAAAPSLPACVTESSTNCYWDATTSGNGLGRSFVDIDGIAYYLP